MARRRPLHTCGASILAIIHTACRKAQELNGPIGTWARRITKCISLFLPLIYAVQCQWLAILSFNDDCILTIEKLAETIFPPSTLLFARIDKLVYIAEVMPGKFDQALNRFPVIMRRIPFLDWALMQIIWWGENMEEKDIMVDMNSNPSSNLMTESADNANCPTSVICSPQEKIFEVEKAESNAELSAVAKSENTENLKENEVKKDNAKYIAESSTSNQTGNLILASQVDSSQEKSILVDHVELPSTAKKEEPLPPTKVLENDASEDKKTKSIDARLESGSAEGTKKETHGKLTKGNTAQKESQQSKVSEEKVGTNKEKDKQKAIKEMNQKDPVLQLFESRWLL